MLIINNQQALDELCASLAKEPLIGMDTEFVRRDSYFPKLSLVQIVTPNLEAIIDYISGIDLRPFNNILQNENIIKILHSASQDIEVFYYLFKELPKNIFDTQIAANVCEYGRAISYSILCEICLSQDIDKTHQAANWLKRPLSKEMLEYAINDARHLIPLYQELSTIIKNANLEEILQTKLKELVNIQNYQADYSKIWTKVRFRKNSKNAIKKMRELAGFREKCAQALNLPRRFVATDHDLVKLSNRLPTNDLELQNLRLEKHNFNKPEYKTKLFQLCTALKAVDNEA